MKNLAHLDHNYLSGEPKMLLNVRVVEIDRQLLDSLTRLVMHGFISFPSCCICKRDLKLLNDNGEVVPNNLMIPKVKKSFICPSDAEYLFCLADPDFKDFDSPKKSLSKVIMSAKKHDKTIKKPSMDDLIDNDMPVTE